MRRSRTQLIVLTLLWSLLPTGWPAAQTNQPDPGPDGHILLDLMFANTAQYDLGERGTRNDSDAPVGDQSCGALDTNPAGCAVSLGGGGSVEVGFPHPFNGPGEFGPWVVRVEEWMGTSTGEQNNDDYRVEVLRDDDVVIGFEVGGGDITLDLNRYSPFDLFTGVRITSLSTIQDPNDLYPGPDIERVMVHRAISLDREITGRWQSCVASDCFSIDILPGTSQTRLIRSVTTRQSAPCGNEVAFDTAERPDVWYGRPCDETGARLVLAPTDPERLVVCVRRAQDGLIEGGNGFSDGCVYYTYEGPPGGDSGSPPTTAPPPTSPPSPTSPPPAEDGTRSPTTIEPRDGESFGVTVILSLLGLDQPASRQTGGNGPALFLATDRAFPDALAVAGITGRSQGATLLVDPTDQVANSTAISQLNPSASTVIGGGQAVPEAALPEHPSGPYPRLAGSTRFATAAAIATANFTAGAPSVYIATGSNYPDALAGGALASIQQVPILLVERDRVPQETVDAMTALRPGTAIILGGDAVISDDVGIQVAGLTESLRATRLSGASRIHTAVFLSQRTFPDGADVVMVANGEDFRSAETAASMAWSTQGPLLLVRPAEVDQVVIDEIQRLDPSTLWILNNDELSAGVITTLEGLTR